MASTTFSLILSKQKLKIMDHLKSNHPFLTKEMDCKTASRKL